MSAARTTVSRRAPSAAPSPSRVAAEREAEPAGGALATGWSFSSLAPTARAALGQAGRPLDASTRRTMEARLGDDLSGVRVHDDARAAAAAADVHAEAFALGRDVVFGRGRYAPSTDAGRTLLAHELAHTIQQRDARTAAPPLEAGSPLEESARAAAGGRVGALGVSALALASAAASPEYFDDAELVQQIAQYTEKLKNPSYPGRSGDADWLERCKAAQRQRASVKASEEAYKKRPRKPASHRRTEAQERAAAVREAESVAADIAVEQVKDAMEDPNEDLEPVSMALPEPGKKPPPKRAAKPKPKKPPRAPSKFDPGGFTNKDIYGETDAALKRINEENAPARDPRHFDVRLAEARSKTPMPALVDDFAGHVFDYGLSNGLFAENERNLVIDTIQGPRRARQHQEAEHQKVMAQYRKQQEFENFRSQLNLMFIQAALMGGPKAPPLVNFAYAAYSGAETGKAVGTAINTGDPVDIGNALIPLAGGIAFHGVMAGGGEPVAPERPSSLPVPEEVTADQVRALWKAEPYAVKKNTSNSFHQQVWERLGGQGPAPRYFRAGRVMQVNELQWEGNIAEINFPEALLEGGPAPPNPAATSPTLPGAYGGTLPGEQPAQPVPDPQPVPEPQPQPQQGPNAPGPSGTLPSAPGAPPAPAPGAQLPPPAVEASVADAADAFHADPNTVFGSSTSDWHDQIWRLSRGAGETPAIYRSGRVFIIDVSRLSDAERAEIGL